MTLTFGQTVAMKRLATRTGEATSITVPVASNNLSDQTFNANTGVQTYDVSGDFYVFNDPDLSTVTWSLSTNPDPTNISINGDGVISFDTDAINPSTSDASIVVTASTGAGSTTSGFSVSINNDVLAALFDGQSGFLHRPSTSTTFTDTGGTTPAAVGNDVAYVTDEADGNDISQGTAPSRASLEETGGGLKYLDFDGSDDFYQFSGNVFSGAVSALTIMIAVEFDTFATFDGLFGISNGGFGAGDDYVLIRLSSEEYQCVFRDGGGATVLEDTAGTEPATGTPYVFTVTVEDGSQSLRVNGTEIDSATAAIGTFTFTDFEFGAYNSGGIPMDGKVFHVMAIDTVLTGEDLTNAEQAFADASGATLP
jgi:hypothetical protein